VIPCAAQVFEETSLTCYVWKWSPRRVLRAKSAADAGRDHSKGPFVLGRMPLARSGRASEGGSEEFQLAPGKTNERM
jgi:hypothetical protein